MVKNDETKIIQDYANLVKSIVRRYKGYGCLSEDLFQEGMIGLLEAKERYQEEKGASFGTYATFWIKKRIIAFLNKESKQSMNALPYNDAIQNDNYEILTENGEEQEIEPEENISLPDELPAIEKQFLILHFEKKKTLAEIAAIMNLPREKVRQIKQKALRRMRLTKN
jgi:RNA polymerase sigma factor (sigma-70 family)